MSRPCDLDAIEARRLIGNKKLSPLELTNSCIEQIEKLNPSINAVVAINNADVLKQAKKAEDDVMSGSELGLLHGLPVGIKDLNIVGNCPVILCLLTDNDYQQALDRSGGKHGNKGYDCAEAAVKMTLI